MNKHQTNKKNELTKTEQKKVKAGQTKALFVILNFIIIIAGFVLVNAQDPSSDPVLGSIPGAVPDPGFVKSGSLSEQQKFDAMSPEERWKKWESYFLENIFNPNEMAKGRTEWLKQLTSEQQTKMLNLAIEKNGLTTKLSGLVEHTNPESIVYKAGDVKTGERIIITDKDKGTQTIPLDNLNNIDKYEIRRDVTYNKISAYVSYAKDGKNGEIFLRDGTYILRVAPSPSDLSYDPNDYNILNSEGKTLYKAHFGESNVAKFLADNSGKYQIWANGHIGNDNNGAEIRLENSDGSITRVFPNPSTPIDKTSGLHYAAVSKQNPDDSNIVAYKVYGNIKTPGFGAIVYKTFDGIIDFKGNYKPTNPNEKVLSVVKGDEKWTINDVQGMTNHVVFNVLDKNFVGKNNFVSRDGKGWVPRYGGIADNQDIDSGIGRIGGGTPDRPISDGTRRTPGKIWRILGESSSGDTTPTITGKPKVEATTKQSGTTTGRAWNSRTRVYRGFRGNCPGGICY